MSVPRRRLAVSGMPERPAGLRPGAGRVRMPAGLPRGRQPSAPPGMEDLAQGLDMLGDVIAEGDAVARSVALCLLALLIDRFPTIELQERAEDVLASFLVDYPAGAALHATIRRLRAGAGHRPA